MILFELYKITYTNIIFYANMKNAIKVPHPIPVLSIYDPALLNVYTSTHAPTEKNANANNLFVCIFLCFSIHFFSHSNVILSVFLTLFKDDKNLTFYILFKYDLGILL